MASIGEFEVEGELGRGGMGVVYRARHRATNEAVALKVILPDAADATFRDRFARETKFTAALAHPNIVAVRGTGEHRGSPWIALELLPNGSLEQKLRGGPLPWREAARLGAGIARGLGAIHGAGLVHRDLKPANVLLDSDGTPKVADLGLVRTIGPERLTRTGELVGTYEFMAPEQAESSAVDARADLYSLGATLFALVTGRPPFEGSGVQLVRRLVTEVPVPLGELVPDVPEPLEQLVRALLAKKPADRPTSASAVAEALATIAEGPSRSSARRRRLARKAARWGGLAGILVLGALGAWSLTRAMSVAFRGPVEPPAPLVSAVAVKRSAARERFPDGPSWLDDWKDDRPLPRELPRGVRFGESAGDYIHAPEGTVLVFVPGRTFLRGRTRTFDSELYEEIASPAHTVSVSPFFLGKYEVTVAQLASFVAVQGPTAAESRGGFVRTGRPEDRVTPDTDRFEPGETIKEGVSFRCRDGQTPSLPDDPAVLVLWREARAYCAWAGLDLPTETEWELAAHWDHPPGPGLPNALFPWGSDDWRTRADHPRLGNVADQSLLRAWPLLHDAQAIKEGRAFVAFPWDDGFPFVAPVHALGAPSWIGAEGMIGNVREWTLDSFDERIYQRTAQNAADPICLTSPGEFEHHVVRGGSFASLPWKTHACHRSKHPIEYASDDVGFRVALRPGRSARR